MRTNKSPRVGPGGEEKVLHRFDACEGFDLEKTTEKKSGGLRSWRCKYCFNAFEKKVRRDTTYFCSGCKVPLCITCNVKYHKWIKFCGSTV